MNVSALATATDDADCSIKLPATQLRLLQLDAEKNPRTIKAWDVLLMQPTLNVTVDKQHAACTSIAVNEATELKSTVRRHCWPHSKQIL